LRVVKKGFRFAKVEEARAALERLHTDFPEVTIPNVNKLFCIIYSKQDKPPVQKWVLEIEVAPGKQGGFVIAARRNDPKPRKPETKDRPEPVGHFTSKVKLKRRP
jgi:hypothetical protein